MKENTLVKVDWIDSSTARGWNTRDKAKKPGGFACTSVGFVIQENKKDITVAGTVGDDGDCLDAITIPRGCIKKIRRIKDV